MSAEMKKCKAYFYVKRIWSWGINKTLALISCELCPRCQPSPKGEGEEKGHWRHCNNCCTGGYGCCPYTEKCIIKNGNLSMWKPKPTADSGEIPDQVVDKLAYLQGDYDPVHEWCLEYKKLEAKYADLQAEVTAWQSAHDSQGDELEAVQAKLAEKDKHITELIAQAEQHEENRINLLGRLVEAEAKLKFYDDHTGTLGRSIGLLKENIQLKERIEELEKDCAENTQIRAQRDSFMDSNTKRTEQVDALEAQLAEKTEELLRSNIRAVDAELALGEKAKRIEELEEQKRGDTIAHDGLVKLFDEAEVQLNATKEVVEAAKPFKEYRGGMHPDIIEKTERGVYSAKWVNIDGAPPINLKDCLLLGDAFTKLDQAKEDKCKTRS